MTQPYDFAKRCKDLADEDQERVSAVFRRQQDTSKAFVQTSGRKFKDDDPKRGGTSPLGGKVW